MYAYLTWSIVFGVIWLLLYIHREDLRYEILFSSLLFLPFGLTEPLFVPEYWNPVVLVKFFGLFYIESFLWCFFTGGIVAVLYEEVFKRKLEITNYDKKVRFHAYFIYVSMIMTVIVMISIKYFTDLSVLRCSFLFMILGFLYFVITRSDLLWKSLASGIMFTVLYIVSLLFIDYLFPGFILNQWNIQGSIGIKIHSIVIEEYIYAFLFGIMWSVIYEEIKNIKLIGLNIK